MSAPSNPSGSVARRPHRYLAAGVAGVAGVAAAGLVGGGAVVAHAAAADTGSPAARTTASTSSSAPSRPAAPAHKPHIDGTVVSVAGSTITVKDGDGFTRVIEVSSSTKYTFGGKSAALSAVTKGRFVHGEGTVDSNGTSLDATTLAISTSAPKAGGPGGPGGHGPGGHGPGGRGPGHLPKAGGKAPVGGPAS